MSKDYAVTLEEDVSSPKKSGSHGVIQTLKKVVAEAIGTYFLVFAGCGSVVLDKIDGSITFPGICITWGLTVMCMIYSVGHISGGHFNPAVTIAFAAFRQFSIKLVPLYIIAQVLGSILASGTLYLMFDIDDSAYFGTVPTGSNVRSLVIEIITTFMLMFVASAVATDNRAIGELAGIAVGSAVLIGVFVAGRVSGASMNPARSIGPAVIMHIYDGLWIYIAGPFVGAILGALSYSLIRLNDKSVREITKSSSFLKSTTRGTSFRY